MSINKIFVFNLKREMLILTGIMALTLLLRLTFLHEPFERDEGLYASIGQEILRGSIPYRDMIEMKPPGLLYLYALGITLFGATIEGVRLFTMCYVLLTVTMVYLTGRQALDGRAGLIAAFLYGIHSGTSLLQGSSSNSEVFLVLPLVCGVYFFLLAAATGKKGYVVGSGICAGLAMLVKTVALPYAVVLMFLTFFLKQGGCLRKRFIAPMLFCAPPVFLVLLTMAYFYFQGALNDFWHWNVTFPLQYSKSTIVSGPSPFKIIPYLMPEMGVLFLLTAPAAIWLLIKNRRIGIVCLVFLIPASIVGVCMPGKYFPHYFIQLVPFLSLVVGAGLSLLFTRQRKIFYVIVVFMTVIYGYGIKKEYPFYSVYTSTEVSMIKYGSVFAESVHIARYIKERTLSSDYIFQWGFEPELYFLANRRSPVPYFTSTTIPATPIPAISKLVLTAQLQKKRPKYIIQQPEWSNQPGEKEVAEYIYTNCVLESIIGYGHIYRCRQSKVKENNVEDRINDLRKNL